MNQESIQLKPYQFSPEELLKLGLYHTNRQLILPFLLMGMSLGGIGFLTINRSEVYVQPWFLMSTYVLLFILMRFRIERKLKQSIWSQDTLNEEIKVSFNSDYIEWQSKSLSGQLRWSEISKFRESKDWILLYLNRRESRTIPLSAFEKEDWELFKQYLGQDGKNT